jgi:formylglycine-generating enzyme required for sulfatase activity
MKRNTYILEKVGFILVCILLFSCQSALSQLPGDVNADGFINYFDLNLIKNHLLDCDALDSDSLIRADANQDYLVDIADMVTIDLHTTFSIPIIYIPVGTFTMGARDDGDDLTYRNSDELPRHEVTLSAYYIGKYEITNGQYCPVLNWAKRMGYLEDYSGGSYSGGGVYINENILLDIDYVDCQISYSGDSFTWKYRDTYSMENHPVVEVSWYGAVAFCNWLSEMEGKTPAYNLSTWDLFNKTEGGYRLPTEAEWERAAAWDGSKHWIYGYTNDYGNNRNRYNHYDDLGGTGIVNPLGLLSGPYTSPVGWFNGVNISPNGIIQTINSSSPVGCYDMSGNVWEWCHDWYSSTYYQGGAMTNPTGPPLASARVVRGGGWLYGAKDCRCANRSRRFQPSSTTRNVGFRVCLQEGGS